MPVQVIPGIVLRAIFCGRVSLRAVFEGHVAHLRLDAKHQRQHVLVCSAGHLLGLVVMLTDSTTLVFDDERNDRTNPLRSKHGLQANVISLCMYIHIYVDV